MKPYSGSCHPCSAGAAVALLAAGGDQRQGLSDAAEYARFRADPVCRSFLSGRAERHGHRLERVGVTAAGGGGLWLAALVGIPLGFLIGRSLFFARMFNPLIALLRPVSPLAWLPIGLLLFQKAEPASSWTIFICSIWPMVINTAEGVRRIPQDYLNVARVLQLSEWTVMRRILFPAVLPAVLTGVRLSIGIAWLVIVAAEMLTGGLGIGFWIWNEWNNLNVENIIIAIVIIGVVGLLLEQGLMLIARRFSWQEK